MAVGNSSQMGFTNTTNDTLGGKFPAAVSQSGSQVPSPAANMTPVVLTTNDTEMAVRNSHLTQTNGANHNMGNRTSFPAAMIQNGSHVIPAAMIQNGSHVIPKSNMTSVVVVETQIQPEVPLLNAEPVMMPDLRNYTTQDQNVSIMILNLR